MLPILAMLRHGLAALRERRPVRLEKRHVRRAILAFVVLPFILMGAEALFRARLRPPSDRAVATRVYARPLVLERSSRPDRNLVEDHLQRLGYERARGQEIGIGEYYLGSRGWIIGRRPFRPMPELVAGGFVIVRLDHRGRIDWMEDEEGNRMSRAALEPELIGRVSRRSQEDRIPVRLEDVPEHLVAAVLRVEDQRFLEHFGLDLRRIGAAAIANMKAGRAVQGGSTLTQQLAKNLYLTPRRSVVRKLREAAMAVTLELRHTKDEILLAYLNQVYLGQDGAVGIHGVGRGAEYLFGKDVSQLDLAESALLVALFRAPSLYSPLRNPETARARRNLVLSLMREGDLISEEEHKEASEAPLGLRKRSSPIRSVRYFTDYALAAMDPDTRAAAVVTTLDPRLQRAAEKAVRDGLARLERDFRWLRSADGKEPLQAALVALDPQGGEILAMVGGRDYGTSQFNRVPYARRQPGSAFKPVVALAALARPDGTGEGAGLVSGGGAQRGAGSHETDRNGEVLLDGGVPRFTLASVLRDEPYRLETPAGLWQPLNYDKDYEGPVTLRDALERSLNVPFARLGMAVGPDRIVETAQNLGIESPLKPFPALALGASEVSPLELTRAFGVLAAAGFRADLRSVLAVADGAGQRLEEMSPIQPSGGGEGVGGRWVYDPAEAY
ncbi:transglycosylase domain-containing protein, partial [Gemmatimonadota bacterium]